MQSRRNRVVRTLAKLFSPVILEAVEQELQRGKPQEKSDWLETIKEASNTASARLKELSSKRSQS